MPQNDRIAALDGLRGVAIVLVLVWHCVGLIDEPHPGTALSYLRACFALTWSGVDLFFVLSGFLLSGILLDRRDNRSYFAPFYVRRFFRIVPLYAALIAVTVVPAALLPWYFSFAQNVLIAIQGHWGIPLGHTWSLAVEEQFYLLLPMAVRLLPPRVFPLAMLTLIGTALAARIWLFAALPDSSAAVASYVLFPCRMDSLLIGAFCAWLVRDKRWHSISLTNIYVSAGLFCGLLIIFLKQRWGIASFQMMTAGLTIVSVFYASVLLIVVKASQGMLAAIFTWSPLRYLGLWSYCIYLFQPTVTSLVLHGHGVSSAIEWMHLTAALALTIAIAALSRKLLEAPMIELGHQWSSRYYVSRSIIDRSP